MNSNRKAEIQRRLSLTAVPTPPEGLADRIKSDIPKYLQATEVERNRFSRSVAFTMRVAASIILLVTSLVVTMRVLSPADEPAMKSAANVLTEAPKQKAELRDAAAAASTAAVDELRVEISEEEPRPVMQVAQQQTAVVVPTTAPSAPAALPAPAPASRRDRAAERQEREADAGVIVDAADTRAVVGGVVGGTVGGVEQGRVQMAERAAAPSFSPVPPAEVASNATAPMTPVAEKITITGNAPSLVKEAHAADLSFAPKATVFGISVDPNAFERVKSTIERGARPAATAVNVEALVNYFAGAPKHVRRDVQLEAEGSPVPVESPGRRGIVRFSVDTKTSELEANSTVPPVGTDARINIAFNSRAVSEFRRIGIEEATTSPEGILLGNTSVTGLYEVELKPNITATTRIATVTLRYTSVVDGKLKTRFEVIRGSDFARKWTLASRRHRLASLGAVWGESLKGSGDGSALASKAEELATQSPNDARARELAAVTRVNSEQ